MLSFHLVTVDVQRELKQRVSSHLQLETVCFEVTLGILLHWKMSILYFDEALTVKEFSGSLGRFAIQSRLDVGFTVDGLPC